MSRRSTIAIIGSGFSGSLLARILAVIGCDVLLLERGAHPRFAIGESTTPLANLTLERLARRYGLPDCHHLAAHGRWLQHLPDVRRGLKRGFTFYRHHAGEPFENRGLDSERLLVAASPDDSVADTHWLRSDVDHHFVREAASAGVDYRDGVHLTGATIDGGGVRLAGQRHGRSFDLRVDFVIDASGPGGFLARQLTIPSGLARTRTRSALVFSHFAGVPLMRDVVPDMPAGPFADDWAAVHHLIDGGWMYSLRFDHGVTSAGFVLSPPALQQLDPGSTVDAERMWRTLLARYPTIGALFSDAEPVMPIAYRARIQHRLERAAGERWVLMPHACAFVDPLFSTGIAWSLRAIERLALCFERAHVRGGVPAPVELRRYDEMLAAEADQIDRLVAGAYHAMAHFELFAAQAMIYFAAVSFAETHQRLVCAEADAAAWSGFLGVTDPVIGPLPRQSERRLRRVTRGVGHASTPAERHAFARWAAASIAPRNVAGLADAARHNLYPVDLDVLMKRSALLGMSREQLTAALPTLRGTAETLLARQPG